MVNREWMKRGVAALAVAVGLSTAVSARASLIPVVSAGTPGGTYTYNVDFASASGSEALSSGDFVTLYDVSLPGGVTATTAPAGWSASVQLVGQTPASLVGAAGLTDSAALSNVTFTYTGTLDTTTTTFSGFSLTVPSSSSPRPGTFSSEDQISLASNVDQLGAVIVPALAPEPASALTLLTVGGFLASRRRRRAAR